MFDVLQNLTTGWCDLLLELHVLFDSVWECQRCLDGKLTTQIAAPSVRLIDIKSLNNWLTGTDTPLPSLCYIIYRIDK